jgi:hypothetical protein
VTSEFQPRRLLRARHGERHSQRLGLVRPRRRTAGFISSTRMYPCQELTVVVLTNAIDGWAGPRSQPRQHHARRRLWQLWRAGCAACEASRARSPSSGRRQRDFSLPRRSRAKWKRAMVRASPGGSDDIRRPQRHSLQADQSRLNHSLNGPRGPQAGARNQHRSEGRSSEGSGVQRRSGRPLASPSNDTSLLSMIRCGGWQRISSMSTSRLATK